MPQYRYQARLSSGQIQAGTVAASDAATAAAMLRGQGHHVLQLAPSIAGPKLGSLKEKLNWSSGPTKKDILDLILMYLHLNMFHKVQLCLYN